MATLRLGLYEARQGNLPPVCMRCGAVASVYRKKVFYHSPWWIYLGIPFGLLPFLILAYFRSKPARVRVPLCPLHRNLWRWQQPGLLLASAVVTVVLGIIPFALVLQGKYPTEKEQKMLFLAAAAIFAGPYLYVCATSALKYLGIHASGVDANSVTLTGVAVEFVEALRVEHQVERLDPPYPGGNLPKPMRTEP